MFGVVADPIDIRFLPRCTIVAFQAKRLDAVYLPFLVSHATAPRFHAVLRQAADRGLSVTIPHKQQIMRYLDAVDPLARRIGAVNTVWKKAGKWRGTNTDITV